MVQSESTKDIPVPARGYSLEFIVGLFALIGCGAIAYLSVGLAGLDLFGLDSYKIYAEFDDISGLKKGASVEISGVKVGEVSNIEFKDPLARVELKIDKDIKIREDDIFSVRTKGIIGDRYIKISRGASDEFVPEGATVVETESAVDFEDIIGKVVHSLEKESK